MDMDTIDPLLCQECPLKAECQDLWDELNADYQRRASKDDRYVPGVWGGQRYGKDLLCGNIGCKRLIVPKGAKGLCHKHYEAARTQAIRRATQAVTV
jgi:hypothetical protein